MQSLAAPPQQSPLPAPEQQQPAQQEQPQQAEQARLQAAKIKQEPPAEDAAAEVPPLDQPSPTSSQSDADQQGREEVGGDGAAAPQPRGTPLHNGCVAVAQFPLLLGAHAATGPSSAGVPAG